MGKAAIPTEPTARVLAGEQVPIESMRCSIAKDRGTKFHLNLTLSFFFMNELQKGVESKQAWDRMPPTLISPKEFQIKTKEMASCQGSLHPFVDEKRREERLWMTLQQVL